MSNIRDKAIDALSIHADLDDPTGTSIALDVALEVTMALVKEAQADAWDEAYEATYKWTDDLWEGRDVPVLENPYRDES